MFISKFIVIIDPPGRAFLQKDVETVIKGESITLTCVVEELGRPAATEYIWRLGGKVINDVKSLNWTIDPVTLETEGNISCVAKNPVGLGTPDFIDVEVFGKFHYSLNSLSLMIPYIHFEIKIISKLIAIFKY